MTPSSAAETPRETPEYFTLEAVAARLRRSRSFVLQEIRRGRLESVHIHARCHVVRREALDRYTRERG